ncbi:MAG: nucleotide pyrophosphohydrolase [Oligoflexales bacterium]
MNDFIQQAQTIHKKFVQERDWEQFHTPKNLTMALSVEVSELMENFQWVSDSQASHISTPETQQNIKEEIADIFCYLVRLADVLDINIQEAFMEKMELNRKKYPIELAKGRMTKYTRLTQDSASFEIN